MELHLNRLIAYAQDTDPELQRQVAEELANQAVKRESPHFIFSLHVRRSSGIHSGEANPNCSAGRAQIAPSPESLKRLGSAALGCPCPCKSVGQL